MFDCLIINNIWRDDARDMLYVSMVREIELPFLPFIGLDISDEDWSSGRIESITWSLDENRFIIEAKDVVLCEDQAPLLLLKEFEDKGWVMRNLLYADPPE